MGIRLEKIPSPDSEIAQDVPEETEMIFQAFGKNVIQAYIKYKAYYDRKANASKLKQADYVYILQPKADHQGSKILGRFSRNQGRFSLDWTLFYRKGFTERYLLASQKWDQ